MLMMSRRAGEVILIGDEIEIVIAHIGRNRVRVGIRAPRELPVLTHEVKLVGEENLAAAAAPACELSRILARLRPSQVPSPPSDEYINRQDAGTKS